jgi:iron complex transport system ATP-binding protein
MLALENLSVARGAQTLLSNISVSFGAGSITAIVGANGVGKSSLLAVACGMLPPRHGTVRLDGVDLAHIDAHKRARAIALVDASEPVLASLTVQDAVANARFAYHRWWEWHTTPQDDAAIEHALVATHLSALRTRELGTLSAGERQRVWIALALAQEARVIAFDEPTAHLDLRYAIETLAHLRRLADDGACVIAVLHSLEEAVSIADRVLVLGNGGVIAEGPPADALTRDAIRRAFDVEIDVELRAGIPSFGRSRLHVGAP